MIIRRIIHKMGINKSYKKRVGNSVFKVPFYNKLGFANFSDFEPWMQEVLLKIGNENSKFLDIGANVGQTLMKWKSAYPNAEYLGIEPNVQCAAYIDYLIKLNKIDNASVLPVAISESTSLLQLYKNETDPSDVTATIVPDFRKEHIVKGEKVISLDYSVLRSYNPEIIKIDVEGAESLIVKSIFNGDNNSKPIIICEILPVYTEENLERLNSQNTIVNTLRKNNYHIFRIDTKNIKLKPLDNIEVHGDLNKCDYLFLPDESSNSITRKFD